MRIALIPLIGIPSLNDSDWYAYTSLIRYILDNRRAYFYLVMQEYLYKKAVRKIADLGLSEYVQVMSVAGEFEKRGSHALQVCYFNSERIKDLFSVWVGQYPVDCVITSKTASIPFLRASLVGIGRANFPPPIFDHSPVCWVECKNIDRALTRHHKTTSATGYTIAHSWVQDSFQDKVISRLIREELAPSAVRSYQEKRVVMPRGFSFSTVRKYYGMAKFDKFSVLYGGRLNQNKRPEMIFSVLSKFVAKGSNVDVYITYPNAQGLEEYVPAAKTQRGFIAYEIANCGKRAYLSLASRVHCALFAGEDESEPVGLTEQLYLLDGMVLVPDRPWARAMLTDDFPWFFDTVEDAIALLSYFYKQYPEAKEKCTWVRSWLEKNKDSRWSLCQELLRIEDAVHAYKKRYSGMRQDSFQKDGNNVLYDSGGFPVWELVKSLSIKYKERGVLHLEEFFRDFSRNSSSGMHFRDEGKLTPAVKVVYEALLSDGWCDTFNSAEPCLTLMGKG